MELQTVLGSLTTLTRDPLVQIGLTGFGIIAFLTIIFATAFISPKNQTGLVGTVGAYLRFFYACFFKPHSGDGTGSQQDALESFYKSQAEVYDATRSRLLHGREDMLALVGSQLKQATFGNKKPIWVDV